MKKKMVYLSCFLICFISACTVSKIEVYKQCKKEIEAINKMRLNVAYLVPVDSLGQYVNDEVISDDMYHHCEVAATINSSQAHLFAILYFDNLGNVRKSIEWWSDGGDLRNVGYYDEQGKIIYAVYNYYENNCGRLYTIGSKRYIDHAFLPFDGSVEKELPANISELASRYKAHLLMPTNCDTISFMPVQTGDYVYLCTNKVYAIPRIDMAKSEEVQWGAIVLVDSIAGDWCTVRIPTYQTSLGYVPIDSIELRKK